MSFGTSATRDHWTAAAGLEEARHRITILESEVRQLRSQIEREEQRADRYHRRFDEWQITTVVWLLGLMQIGGGLLFLVLLAGDKSALGAIPLLVTGIFTMMSPAFWGSETSRAS